MLRPSFFVAKTDNNLRFGRFFEEFVMLMPQTSGRWGIAS